MSHWEEDARSFPFKVPQGSRGDDLADAKGCRRGRRGSVQNVYHAFGFEDMKVIHKPTRGIHGLSAHARGRRSQVLGADLRDEALQRARERASAEAERHLAQARPSISGDQAPEAGEGDHLSDIPSGEAPSRVPLAFEGECGVRTGLDASIQTTGEVNAEKGHFRVGHGIDEIFDQETPFGDQFVIIASKWDDAQLGMKAAEARHAIGLKTGAADKNATSDVASCRL